MAVLVVGLAAAAWCDEPLLFEQHVRPILKTHCFQCHGEGGQHEGGLDLRLRRFMVGGGDSGPAISPGDREDSYLFARLEVGEMPPGEVKLAADEIALIGRWIDAGAPTLRDEPDELGDGYLFTEEERHFWAFQPVRPVKVPTVAHRQQVRTPIDAFLLSRLEEKQLTFSAEADKQTLLRRACFDLLGLPPTPEQVRAFMADEAPDAYDRLIDRLLASPHYGERWGRHWLDAAGYADSEGYTADDAPRRAAYKYRDYVIRSFNADKPFDRFVEEQLAGDEMVEPPYQNLSPEQIDLLTATGFLRMAPDGTGSGGVDQGLARNQVVADTINIVSTALLGLTVGCAQCHDHRYDPIPQKDYYRLRAIFEPAYNPKHWRTPRQRLISLYTDADRAEARRIEQRAHAIDVKRQAKQRQFIERTLEAKLEKVDPELREAIRHARATPPGKRLPIQEKILRENPATNVTAGSLYLYDRKAADELKKMAAEAKKIRDTKPIEDFVRCLTEVPGEVPTTSVFIRGDHEQPGDVVHPAGLSILAGEGTSAIPEDDPSRSTTGRRTAYAHYLTSGHHPLCARVMVNRVWMHHFGHGIVETPGDFGALGARPTHPKLLDWLAGDFVAGGWRLKRLHRMIMTSTAYRQQSERSDKTDAVDPENHLYGRMSVRRLEAESIRDAMMVACGKLEPRMFGKPVPIREDEVGQVVVGIDTTDSAGRPTGKVIPLNGQEFRRSVYITVRRSQPLAVLDTFDAPVMQPNCDRRTASTVTPQALLLMNSQFIRTMAEYFARRVHREAEQDPTAQVTLAWQLAFSRKPTGEQLQRAVEFLNTQVEHLRATAMAKADAEKEKKQANPQDPTIGALTSFCQALLSSNRLLYVD